MSDQHFLAMMFVLCTLGYLLYKIWNSLDTIASNLDQSDRLNAIERRLNERPLDGDEWKYR